MRQQENHFVFDNDTPKSTIDVKKYSGLKRGRTYSLAVIRKCVTSMREEFSDRFDVGSVKRVFRYVSYLSGRPLNLPKAMSAHKISSLHNIDASPSELTKKSTAAMAEADPTRTCK